MTKFLELMAKLNISTVYWVDDENAEGSELSLDKLSSGFISSLIDASEDEAKGAMGAFLKIEALRAPASKIQTILKAKDEDELSKSERIATILEGLLEKIDNPAQTLADALRKLPGPLGGAERDALISLFNRAGNTQWTWQPLSFTKWGNEGTRALGEAVSTKPVLFVVDLQNTSEKTAADGRSVLSDLAKAQLDRKTCHLIVLTSECRKDEEFRKGRKLTEDVFTSGPQRIPVFALSKGRFSVQPEQISEHMASAFASALERVDLSLVHLEFADIMREHFRKSIEIAFNTLERLTIEELMFAVTRTSKDEGVSETETLVRLMNIAQREEFQHAIAESPKLRETILKLRDANLPIERTDLETDGEIVKLRGAELYDKPAVVNKLYSPLSPGDLFAIRSHVQETKPDGAEVLPQVISEQLYVLVANACDLMLRGDGTRRLDACVLLRLDDPTKGGSEKQFTFQLRHLEFTNVANATTKQIELRQYKTVPLTLLDLCWTNAEGQCTWSPSANAETKDKLLGSQRLRITALDEEFKHLDGADLAGIARPLKMEFQNLTSDAGEILQTKFEMRRVGRLSHTHAMQLVSRFTGVFGRHSEEHDFSKSP